MGEMFIMSVKWTKKPDPYITFWGPDDSGYLWPIEEAGRYTEDHVRINMGYYHDGSRTLAVPVAAVLKHAVAADPEWMDRRTNLTAVPRSKLRVLMAAALAWAPNYPHPTAQAEG